ncbi:MAG: calcium-binding protein, partial [Leisingera sp.]
MTFFGQSAVEIEAEMLTGGDIFWLGDLQSFSVGPGDDFVLHALGSIDGGTGQDTIGVSSLGLLDLEITDDGVLFRDGAMEELVFTNFEFVENDSDIFALVAGTNGADSLSGDHNPENLRDMIVAGDGNDSVESGSGRDYVIGGQGDDNLFGGKADDTLIGGAGDDTLNGGRRRDFLWGGEDDDLILGRLHDDYAFGGNGNDTLIGGGGDDKLRGWEGNDLLIGSNGRDTLEGGAGRDIYYGGAGRDLHRLGDGAETLVFGRSDGRDGVQHFRIGRDKVQFGGLDETGSLAEYGFDDLEFKQKRGDVVVKFEDTVITFHNRELNDIAIEDHFLFL